MKGHKALILHLVGTARKNAGVYVSNFILFCQFPCPSEVFMTATHLTRTISLSCLLTVEGWTETPVDVFRSEEWSLIFSKMKALSAVYLMGTGVVSTRSCVDVGSPIF